MMKKILFLVLVFSFAYFQSLEADTVYLNNGACYDGEVIYQTDDELTIQLDIGELTIDNEDIKSVRIDKKKKEVKKKEKEEAKLSDKMLVVSSLKKKALNINDFRCKLRMEICDGSTISGTMLCKYPDKLKSTYLVTSNSKDMGRMEVKAVSDGKIFWIYYPQLNVIYKQAAGSENSIAPGMDELMPAPLLEKLSESNCAYLGKELLNNVSTACFEMTIEASDAGLSGKGQNKEIAKCKMYFREIDGFLIKNIGYDKEGNILFINNTKDIEININVDENEFYFKAPEGVEVLDASVSTPANLDGML